MSDDTSELPPGMQLKLFMERQDHAMTQVGTRLDHVEELLRQQLQHLIDKVNMGGEHIQQQVSRIQEATDMMAGNLEQRHASTTTEIDKLRERMHKLELEVVAIRKSTSGKSGGGLSKRQAMIAAGIGTVLWGLVSAATGSLTARATVEETKKIESIKE